MLYQKEVDNLNCFKAMKDIFFLTKNFWMKKLQAQKTSLASSTKHLRKKWCQIYTNSPLKLKKSIVGRIVVSTDVHVLIPETNGRVASHAKRGFIDVTKLWILRWRDYPALSWWAQGKHRSACKWKTEARELKLEIRWCYTVSFEEGRQGCEPRNANSLWKPEKQGNWPS